MRLPLESSSIIIRVSSGEAATATTVTTVISVRVSVNSRRMKAAPWSASSFSARTSTGTTRAVSTEPSTISVIRLGSVFAVLKDAATTSPSAAPMSTVRMKPVMREIKVATAMEPVARTTFSPPSSSGSASVCGSATAVAAPAVPAATVSAVSGGAMVSPLGLVVRSDLSGAPSSAASRAGLVSRGTGTGAGGAGVTMRRRVPLSVTWFSDHCVCCVVVLVCVCVRRAGCPARRAPLSPPAGRPAPTRRRRASR